MVKVKKLKLRPSARDKRRYFLVRATNAKIEAVILEYVGILGFAKSAYLEVRGSGVGGRGYSVGSCLTKSLDEVRAALALAGIRIEKVSGTLRSLGN
ncbi:hypothetical protein KAT36_03155 [Candidatus Pacearchaeota archaeon]|nr:hypothetical protein [Candidatus Pacearchaeota archaeon]